MAGNRGATLAGGAKERRRPLPLSTERLAGTMVPSGGLQPGYVWIRDADREGRRVLRCARRDRDGLQGKDKDDPSHREPAPKLGDANDQRNVSVPGMQDSGEMWPHRGRPHQQRSAEGRGSTTKDLALGRCRR